MASPRAFRIEVLKSNTSVATGEPDTNFRVAVASLLMAQRRCRTTSKVIGSSCRLAAAVAMVQPPRHARRSRAPLLHRHDQVQVLVHAHRLARVDRDGGRAA